MNHIQLLTGLILTMLVRSGLLENTFANHSDLLTYVKEINETITNEGYMLDSFITNGYYGFVFKAHDTRKTTTPKAIKVTWDYPLIGQKNFFASCINYDIQIALAKKNTDIFAPIKNIRIPDPKKLKKKEEPKYCICITIMPFAQQDLLTALNFLFKASDSNEVRETNLVKFIKTIVDMNIRLNDSGYLHGDLKAANVLLVKERGRIVPKLNDFDLLHNIEKDFTAPGDTDCKRSVIKEKKNLSDAIDEIIQANTSFVKVKKDLVGQLHTQVFDYYLKLAKKKCKNLTEEFSEELGKKELMAV